MSSTKLNGNLGLVLRWLILGATVAGFYYGFDRRLERIEYRIDHEFVSKEAMRSWVDDLRLHNTRTNVPDATAIGDPH